MIENIFLFIFVIIVIADLLAVIKELKKLEYIAKPLLMPTLALYFVFRSFMNGTNWLIILALLFGCSGDILLMLENKEKWFMFGMIGFLIGHIFYISAFLISIGDNLINFPIWGLILISPVLIILFFTFPKYRRHMGEFKIPIYIYMTVILLMHFTSILRLALFNIYCLCFILVYIGSLLFIFSDSLIAINTFKEDAEISHFYIMITYILGQFLIIQGILISI